MTREGVPRPRSLLLDNVLDHLQQFVSRGSLDEAQRLGSWLGKLSFLLAKRDRARALQHLAIAFPELDDRGRSRLARATFTHFGKMLGETLWLSCQPAESLLDILQLEDLERVQAATSSGRPTFLVSGHCGHWELIHAGLCLLGFRVYAFARDLSDPLLGSRLLAFRARYGTRTILRGSPDSPRDLLRALRSAGILGFAIDQDTRVEGTWVPFFGRPAYTPIGPAEMALRFRAQVVPAFTERLPCGRHRVRFEAPLELPRDPVDLTAAMTARIEAQIRRVPDQWVWNHSRWRRQPGDSSGASRFGSTSRAPAIPST